MKDLVPSEMLAKWVEGWTKVSEHLHVHSSGARIERRGYPARHGWYLLPTAKSEARRFEPTAAGCDEAFVAFAGQQALAAYLSRILGPSAKRKRAG